MDEQPTLRQLQRVGGEAQAAEAAPARDARPSDRPDPSFEIVWAGALERSAVPTLSFAAKVTDGSGIEVYTIALTAQIMIIIGASALLSWILAREQVPQTIAESLLGLTDNPIVFLLIVNVLLILCGMILEPTSALLIITPILLPIAVEFGVDPVQLGSIIIFNLMIGLLTPPMGGVVFVLSSVTGIPVERVFRGAAFYLPAMLLVLLLITYVPAVTLWLPEMIGL